MKTRQIEDDVLGIVEWNDHLDHGEAQVELSPDHVVDLVLQSTGTDLFRVLARARSFVMQLKLRDALLRKSAAEALLDEYNNRWSQGEPIDARTFTGRIWLSAITFEADGRTQVFYEDEDLFDGRGVVVPLNPDGSVNHPRIRETN